MMPRRTRRAPGRPDEEREPFLHEGLELEDESAHTTSKPEVERKARWGDSDSEGASNSEVGGDVEKEGAQEPAHKEQKRHSMQSTQCGDNSPWTEVARRVSTKREIGPQGKGALLHPIPAEDAQALVRKQNLATLKARGASAKQLARCSRWVFTMQREVQLQLSRSAARVPAGEIVSLAETAAHQSLSDLVTMEGAEQQSDEFWESVKHMTSAERKQWSVGRGCG